MKEHGGTASTFEAKPPRVCLIVKLSFNPPSVATTLPQPHVWSWNCGTHLAGVIVLLAGLNSPATN